MNQTTPAILLRQAQQTTAQWSGGTSTQLYIFPEGSEYGKHNFRLRISTAAVTDETSTFTSLPGISRQLMILDGTLIIRHADHYTKTLHPFDTDSFDGGWHTTGEGKVTDFNIMTSGDAESLLQCRTVKAGESFITTPSSPSEMIGYYLLEGTAKINMSEDKYTINSKDFLITKPSVHPVKTSFSAIHDCIVILSFITLRNN